MQKETNEKNKEMAHTTNNTNNNDNDNNKIENNESDGMKQFRNTLRNKKNAIGNMFGMKNNRNRKKSNIKAPKWEEVPQMTPFYLPEPNSTEASELNIDNDESLQLMEKSNKTNTNCKANNMNNNISEKNYKSAITNTPSINTTIITTAATIGSTRTQTNDNRNDLDTTNTRRELKRNEKEPETEDLIGSMTVTLDTNTLLHSPLSTTSNTNVGHVTNAAIPPQSPINYHHYVNYTNAITRQITPTIGTTTHATSTRSIAGSATGRKYNTFNSGSNIFTYNNNKAKQENNMDSMQTNRSIPQKQTITITEFSLDAKKSRNRPVTPQSPQISTTQTLTPQNSNHSPLFSTPVLAPGELDELQSLQRSLTPFSGNLSNSRLKDASLPKRIRKESSQLFKDSRLYSLDDSQQHLILTMTRYSVLSISCVIAAMFFYVFNALLFASFGKNIDADVVTIGVDSESVNVKETLFYCLSSSTQCLHSFVSICAIFWFYKMNNVSYKMCCGKCDGYCNGLCVWLTKKCSRMLTQKERKVRKSVHVRRVTVLKEEEKDNNNDDTNDQHEKRMQPKESFTNSKTKTVTVVNEDGNAVQYVELAQS